jgi:hypothetical protein
MPGINLSRSAEQSAELKKYDSFGRGAISILAILALTLVAWGGIAYYERNLSAEIDGIVSEISEKRGVFSSIDVDDVADFQFRLEILKTGLKEQISPAGMLGSVEGLLLPGVVLGKYAFDAEKKAISLSGKADALGTIARQMVLMKRIPGFSGLSMNSLSREEGGAFEFDLSIALSL